MNRIFFFALVSSLAGFLFGFDTVVISGAEQTIQKLWGLSPGLHGIAMATALYGTVIGSFGSILSLDLTAWAFQTEHFSIVPACIQAIPFRKSLNLQSVPPADAPLPFSFLAPSLRLGPKRSRALAKASFTNSLLPITAPSVK